MYEKKLVLPFVTKAPNQKESMSYPAELACVTCMAESQRKKPSILRDASEKILFISKVYYPLWVLVADNSSLIIDGLTTSTHDFSFEEPTKIGVLIEELKNNSIFPQKLSGALQNQVKATKEFTSTVNLSFAGLVDNKELLSFLAGYFETGAILRKDQEETDLIPVETGAKEASATVQAFVYCLRSIEAYVKGLKYTLAVLKEEIEFQTNAASGEIELLKEKRDSEIAARKPIVDKTIRKIAQKQERTIANLQKSIDLKIGGLEKKREKYMHKLQIAEQRRDTVQKKVEGARKSKNASKSSSGSFALQKYGREIDNIKKEIRAISDDFDRLKKEGEICIKVKKAEFQNAITQEESQLLQLENAYNAKTDEKQRQIDEMKLQSAAITSSLENRIGELKRSSNTLRKQVEINWKLDDPEESILVHLPFYLVKYVKGENERYSLLSPITISEDVSVLNELKKILLLNPDSKLRTLMHPANKILQETLNATVLGKMQSDPAFRSKVDEMCRASNLIDQTSFSQTLNEGLDEIENRGWMSHEEAAALCRHVMRE